MTLVAEDAVVGRALEAIARTRTRGMHFLGHFVGIDGRPAPVGSVLMTLAAPTSDDGSHRQLPLLSFCAFADLVLMSAIRSHVGAGARLGTVTLSIQHRRVTGHGEIVGVATAPEPQDGYGTSQAVYTIEDEVVAHAHASAAALPPPPGRTPALLPWELDPLPAAPPVDRADLDSREDEFLTKVQEAHARAHERGTSVEDELINFTWNESEPGSADGCLLIGPELGNRVGHLQGGALYVAAARAARHALGDGSWELAEGSYQFLRPGDGKVLVAAASVRRSGRSIAFVEALLAVDDVMVGAGLFTFRASSP